MIRKIRYVISAIILCCLIVWIILSLRYTLPQKRLTEGRRRDVETLVQVCLSTTNLSNTEELLAAVAQRGIRLSSPIPKDPSKPCYRLVRHWSAQEDITNPVDILITETNVKDTNGVFVATMAGSVLYVARHRLKPE